MTFKFIVNSYFSNISSKKDYYLYQILFDQFLYNKYDLKNKYDFLKNTLNNIFFSEKTKQEFIDVFCKIQSIYFSFIKFKYAYFRKYKTVYVSKDLYGNEIDINNKYVICIFHKNGNYLFHIRDLKKIIDNNLTNGSDLFFEPKPIKNPYNNILFNKSTLYNIYFLLRDNTNYQIDLINKYFLENFNLNSFFRNYEYIIREYMINNYVNEHNSDHLQKLIFLMIDEYNKLKFKSIIKVDNCFPKERLINIFKPYLIMYLKSIYSYATVTKYNNYNIVMNKLFLFAKYNPTFGVKKYRLHKKYVFYKKFPIITKTTYYDENHIKFLTEETEEFCNSHLTLEPPSSFNSRIEDLYRRISNLVDNISNIDNNSLSNQRYRFSMNTGNESDYNYSNDISDDDDSDETSSNSNSSYRDERSTYPTDTNQVSDSLTDAQSMQFTRFYNSNNIFGNQNGNNSEEDEREEYERQLDLFFSACINYPMENLFNSNNTIDISNNTQDDNNNDSNNNNNDSNE